MGTVLALGLLVAMCGFIAYSGDLLGRRLGKRRLTLWGLRPRHTAIVVTVFTGMLIAGLSLVAMIGFSAGVRRAVIHGEALLRENWTLKRENGALKRDNGRQARLSQELQKRSEEQGLRIAAQIHQIDAQAARNRQLGTEKERLQRRSEELTRFLAEGKARNARLEASRERLEARIAALETNRRHLLTRNSDLRGATAATRRRLNGVQRQLFVAKNALSTTQDELMATQAKLRAVHIEHGIAMARAFKRLDSLRETNRALQERNLVARRNEELARTEIAPGASDATIRDAVRGLVERAESAVKQRYRVLPVSLPRVPVILQPSWVPPSDVVNRYVNVISAQGQGVVVRAAVIENAAAGASVPVRIDLAPNQLAFRKGEEIAAVVVDGNQSEGVLLRRLLQFLQESVRERALLRGVLPTTDGRVGEIQYDPLLETVRKIREIGGPARVGAVASNDVWSVGPLGLDFYVLPGESRVADGPR
jgi:uncharacterized protein (DUF3084 family)